jgi:F-type H+-transporting ATPase subunit epsilon
MATFTVDIVSAERQLLSVEATGLFVTTPEGSLGILPKHQPLLAALAVAGAEIELPEGGRRHVAVHQGYVYYSGGDTAVILADVAELAEEIDLERSRGRLLELQALPPSEHVHLDVPAAIRRHEVRVAVAEKVR